MIGEPPSFSGTCHFMVKDVLVMPETSKGPLGGPGGSIMIKKNIEKLNIII